MWIWAIVASAVALGFYDVAKKQALKKNGVLIVLFASSLLSTIMLIPFFSAGSTQDHLSIMLKAVIVTASWVSGLLGMKYLPLTTASMIKASRPVFVLIFSLILFKEHLGSMQWVGILLSIAALFFLSKSSKKEGIDFLHSKGIMYMGISVICGVVSALYDKYIMREMEPLFVQSWCNLYITILLGLIILGLHLIDKNKLQSFRWDWTLLLISIFITIADYLYFYALSCEGSLLSVTSLVRRFSVVVAFVSGAVLFKENHIKSKAVSLLVLIAGMAFIVIGTN